MEHEEYGCPYCMYHTESKSIYEEHVKGHKRHKTLTEQVEEAGGIIHKGML